MKTSLLAKVPLFHELPVVELELLASGLKVLDAQPGTVLFRENDPGEEFYIVIDGKAEVVQGMDSPDERLLATLAPGDFTGEMSLLIPDGHRTASARVLEPSRLWVMDRKDFDSLLHRRPTIVYSIVRALSQRLSATNNATFRDLQLKNVQLQRAYDELKAAQAQLIEKERLEKELQLAQDIQMSILPHTLPSLVDYDFGAYINPARQVGGDFYDIIKLDADRAVVIVGDVADKGVPSAIFMARTHALLIAETLHEADPEKVLAQVNQVLTQMEQANLFVTVIYGILDRRTRTFTYTRAGHEIPLVLTADGVRRMPHGPGQPVGILDAPIFDTQLVEMPPGSSVLLFTDGMTDCRNPKGEEFGRQRLEQELARLDGLNAQGICVALAIELGLYQDGSPQDDDVTLVAIHAA
jgi:sigma-B regulation protein RsbU (phosphoserine phosphatase)